MAKKKRTVRKARKASSSSSRGNGVLWGAIIVALKVLGVAFLVQGFVLQLATGVLYNGMVHYAIGVIFFMLAWHAKKKCSTMC